MDFVLRLTSAYVFRITSETMVASAFPHARLVGVIIIIIVTQHVTSLTITFFPQRMWKWRLQ